MKKLLVALFVVAVLLVGAGVFFAGKLDGLIAETIQTEGSAAIGQSVTVDKVETKFADGVAVIKGLAIANPPGYQSAHAVKVNTFSASVDYEAQSVDTILINNPVINAELVGIRSNFQDILDGMPETAEKPETSDEGDDFVLDINSIQIRKATVNINSDKIGQSSFVMDDLVMNNLSGTADELSEEITNRLISHVTNQVKTFATAQITELLKAKALAEAKELVNEKLEEEVTDKVKDKLGDKLKGLKLKLK